MDELLSLKWNNHCSTFLHILSNVRNKQKYTDVTLACAGKFYCAHRIVLSSCSDYFSEIFDTTEEKNLVILLKDIGSEALEALLDYMYIGEVNVKQTELSSLIKAAECLQVKGLAVEDEEPNLKASVPSKKCLSSPRPKRKRKLDDNYSSSTSPPAKIKSSQPLIRSDNTESDKTEEKITDSDDIKNIVIKEENIVFQPEVFSIDDDYLEEDNINNEKTGDEALDPLNCLPKPSTSETDKNLDDNSYLEDSSFPEDNSYSAASYNEDSNDWQGDDFDGNFPTGNYSNADPPSTSPIMKLHHQCPICSRYFRRADNMRAHISETHTRERRFSCIYCNYKAARRGTLRQHLVLKHGHLLVAEKREC